MKRIGITGINGFIGWHLRCFLKSVKNVEVIGATRETFESEPALHSFVESCDAIVHLAGMICGDVKEIAKTNLLLTNSLIHSCDQMNVKPHLIFASSTHIFRHTPYGDSKIECALKFRDWAGSKGIPFTNLILSNIFGEGGKPFYNSVVSTFCHQLAHDETPTIMKDIELEQVHVQHVAKRILEIVMEKQCGDLQIHGTPITVTGLLEKLKGFRQDYEKLVFPNLSNEFDLDLFMTYLSYLFPASYPRHPVLHSDDRGHLFETVKSHGGGQIFISSTKPGITRGNHYHSHKFERFFVLKGEGEIRIRKLYDLKPEVFRISGENPGFVDIPALHTHSITNVGKEELITLFWCHKLFDPSDTDTIFEKVDPE